MPTKVVMPQMGESITEGTIVRWFKEVGDTVKKDEPLLEISTDKVDAEVPSPAEGTVTKILHGPGDTVAVEEPIAIIAAAGEEGAEAEAAPAGEEEAPAEEKEPEETKAPAEAEPKKAEKKKEPEAPAAGAPASEEPAPQQAAAPEEEEEPETVRRRSSPLVRRIASEHGVDLADVEGTGIHGRVTKEDILAFVDRRSAAPAKPAAAPKAPAERPAREEERPSAPPAPPAAAPARREIAFSGDEYRERMTVMRQRIAEHMVASKRTSPHVHTVFEVDMSRVVAIRERGKEAFEAQYGLRLTYTPFIMAAAVAALHEFPALNATLDGDEIVYHRRMNIGVAVALDNGLIVPVVRNAEERSIVGLQRAITDLAGRARSKQLKPDEVQGSTFSITNPGPFGGLFGLPVINQPNVAILHVGNISRRPLVVTDEDGREAIAIRDVAYLALSFDHRLIDGAVADQFMARLKTILEEGRFEVR